MDRTQRVIRLIQEITLEGIRESADDSPEDAELRARLVDEISDIERRKGIVEIPAELP